MPNKYEREIEEILRNLERTEPKATISQRVQKRIRRKTQARPRMAMPQLSFSDWCLVIALVAALAAGGWAYAQNNADVITGTVALIGAVCILLVALSNFLVKPRSSSATRYNNVTRLHRNPFRRMMTSWHLLMLKLRYRRNRSKRES